MLEPLEKDLARLGKLVPVPLRPLVGVTEADARRIRQFLRKVPTWKLEEALDAATKGLKTGFEILDRNRVTVISSLEEMLSERGQLWRRK